MEVRDGIRSMIVVQTVHLPAGNSTGEYGAALAHSKLSGSYQRPEAYIQECKVFVRTKELRN